MKTTVGTKATITMADGLRWPAVATGEETSSVVTILDKKSGEPVDITVTRNDFISLRTSRAGDEYLRPSNEVVMYGYRIVTGPRVSPVIGLDVDTDGVLINLQSLLDNAAEADSAFRANLYAARHGITAAADL